MDNEQLQLLADAARIVANHGFALDEFGNVDELSGWNALVDTTAVGLLSLGEVETHSRMVASRLDQIGGYLVWIMVDNDGHTSLVDFGDDQGLRSGTDSVERRFNEAMEAAE